MLVQDGAQYFGASLATVWGNHPAFVQAARRGGVRLLPPGEVADVPPVVARINHNRWIADCPTCGGACMVWLDEPVLLCAGCLNGAVGHRWRPVALPNDVAEIAAALMVRPDPATRHWEPGETVADLLAENAAHGLGEG